MNKSDLERMNEQPTENMKAATGASGAANSIHISKAVDIQPLKHEDTVQPLKLQTTDEIEKAQLTAPPFVIDDLLVAGLTVLAAPPKIGKSWFCLDMGTCIAEGRSFLGRSTHQGDVLYLDLESRDYRVQNRMKTAALRGSKHLHIAFKASTLGDGNLLTQITQVHAQIARNTLFVPQRHLTFFDLCAMIKTDSSLPVCVFASSSSLNSLDAAACIGAFALCM